LKEEKKMYIGLALMTFGGWALFQRNKDFAPFFKTSGGIFGIVLIIVGLSLVFLFIYPAYTEYIQYIIADLN